MRYRTALMLCLTCALLPTMGKLAHAETHEPTLEERFPPRELFSKRDKILTFEIENDSIGGKGTDRNYTSGVRASYFDINADVPTWAGRMLDTIPGYDVNATTSLYYSLGQNLYTPENIENPRQNPNDRPWAAWAYGSVGASTLDDNHNDIVELTLGMVGPAALGEDSQRFVHKFTNSPDPKGWDNQLKNEPGVILSWERRWPAMESVDVGDLHMTVTPSVGVTGGNIYTYASSGLYFQITPSDTIWQDVPLRVRPAQPGTGFYEIPKDGFSWSVFGGVDGRAVARNLFLDGNTFADSHSIDKKTFVADFNAGASVTIGRTRISYTNVYRTKEFDGQDDSSVFGGISISRRF
ncbi:MAG: lipid A deacylase LpxR family protein [Pseudobdellovibrionaceae bacterium]